jgi:hypothetical protein
MSKEMRVFKTGASRNSEEGKNDYEGFYSPLVIKRFGDYMTLHRKQAYGVLRASDNWKKGIPRDAYIKSALRHFLDIWTQHEGYKGEDTLENSLCALLFNIQGYLYEVLKEKQNEK